MALRADPPHVVRPLVAGGLQLPVVGGALGLALAVAATRLPGGLPFEIDALDPLTFLGVPPGLAAAALPATYLPAHRGRLGSIPSLCSGPTECGRPERHGPQLQATQHGHPSAAEGGSPYWRRPRVREFRLPVPPPNAQRHSVVEPMRTLVPLTPPPILNRI